jgi:retron-type reverse transcriptase
LNGDWNVDSWRYDWVLDPDIKGFFDRIDGAAVPSPLLT